MNVIFHYRAGHEKLMSERFAKILQDLGHGHYRIDESESESVYLDPAYTPDPVVVHAEIAVRHYEPAVIFKAERGRKPKFKSRPESQPETKTDND